MFYTIEPQVLSHMLWPLKERTAHFDSYWGNFASHTTILFPNAMVLAISFSKMF